MGWLVDALVQRTVPRRCDDERGGLSLTIAALAATMACVLGTIAALVMVRFGRFRGSNGFAFMITAPLVMPDVITGLSLLLLFVALAHAIGWRRIAACSPSGWRM